MKSGEPEQFRPLPGLSTIGAKNSHDHAASQWRNPFSALK
jgi:hypothetical protein